MSSSTQLNQLTSPGFPHNLTESVQKVMMPIHDDHALVIHHQPKVLRRSSSRPSSSPNISPSAKEVQHVLSKLSPPRTSLVSDISPMAMYNPALLHTPQPLSTPSVSSPHIPPTTASGTVMSPVITTHVINMQALGNSDVTNRHTIATRLDLTSAKPTVDNSKRIFPSEL